MTKAKGYPPPMRPCIDLYIRCAKEPQLHAKVIRMHGLNRESIEEFANLLCGTSRFFVHKPGALSPIGKCATCGAKLNYEISDRTAKAGTK